MSKNEINTPKNNKKFSLKDIFFTTIFTIAFIIQIILMFIVKNEFNIPLLSYSGWVTWIISLYLVFVPFFSFKKQGVVEKGKSYIHTSKVVKNGTYAIIRHPQYLGGILFTISISLWNPVWFNLILSVMIIVLTYQWTYTEDISLIEKFGEDYKHYKKKVPRLNPILGLIVYYIRKKSDNHFEQSNEKSTILH